MFTSVPSDEIFSLIKNNILHQSKNYRNHFEAFYACHFLAVLDQWFPLVSTTNNTVSHNKTEI
jgi:hypothetical protein